ncbi:hypothetical protein [Agrobacterium tumefaciens]|uniref:hypothetical protein n=1 Tax=Agrobacterium tumefaciens TaxID=358 RepID=UPI0015736B79|nr:hypothetical protein [Agrobacterium tumefaciens]
MHDQSSEHAVAEYVAEQTNELITLVNLCAPSDRMKFLAYLLEMVHSQAKLSYKAAEKLTPVLVHSREEKSAAD